MVPRWTLAALAAAGLLGAGAVVAARRPLPRTHGTLRVPGLQAPVRVIRDRWGVPHVFAASPQDLFFTQGYIHAQERLWQMELNRRLCHGELAELFGPIALDSDRYARIIGFTRVAHREVALLRDDVRAMLEDYCGGINAFLAATSALPVELSLLNARPRMWAPVDVLVLSKLLAMQLCDSWSSEAFRERASVAAAAAELPQPQAPVPDLPGGASGQGSNAWVLSGQASSSGRPLLANDPHLLLTQPSLWFEMHLDAPGLQVAGASLPGSPGILLGHNARIAWGLTNGMVDAEDLVIERAHPDDPTRFAFRDSWEAATVIRETIRVKGQAEPHIETVLVTRHGPLIQAFIPNETRPIALRWTALSPGTTVQALADLQHAHDFASFRQALSAWVAPAQNVVYADIDGNIGYYLAGRLIRRQGAEGSLPVPGWDGEHEWADPIPSDQNPQYFNPPSGRIVSANDRHIRPADYPYQYGADYWNDFRQLRISELLAARPLHDLDSLAAIQNDLYSSCGLRLARLAAHLPSEQPLAQQAREILLAWDGMLTAESPAGAIYELLRYHLGRLDLAQRHNEPGFTIGLGLWLRLPASGAIVRRWPELLSELEQALAADTAQSEPARVLLRRAWELALRDLRAEQGDDPARWSYGRSHQLLLRHTLDSIPALARLLNRGAYPTGGDFDTVNVGRYDRDFAVQRAYVGPSYRLLCDLADWDRTRSIHSGGQSGHPSSRHYADLVQLWRSGRYHPLLWTRQRIEAEAEAQLQMVPA